MAPTQAPGTFRSPLSTLRIAYPEQSLAMMITQRRSIVPGFRQIIYVSSKINLSFQLETLATLVISHTRITREQFSSGAMIVSNIEMFNGHHPSGLLNEATDVIENMLRDVPALEIGTSFIDACNALLIPLKSRRAIDPTSLIFETKYSLLFHK